ncbi:MAG TPA: hypothetical protein VH880_08085 [Anaeromyxobacteraceae bacterium]|jgi:hypothetical protein
MAVETVGLPGGEVLLRFEGTFEAQDAWRVREALRGGGARVVLDFGQVRIFQDFAIALIAPDIAAAGDTPVRVRGLGLHQRRILEYFGVTPAPAEERAREAEAEAELRP